MLAYFGLACNIIYKEKNKGMFLFQQLSHGLPGTFGTTYHVETSKIKKNPTICSTIFPCWPPFHFYPPPTHTHTCASTFTNTQTHTHTHTHHTYSHKHTHTYTHTHTHSYTLSLISPLYLHFVQAPHPTCKIIVSKKNSKSSIHLYL